MSLSFLSPFHLPSTLSPHRRLISAALRTHPRSTPWPQPRSTPWPQPPAKAPSPPPPPPLPPVYINPNSDSDSDSDSSLNADEISSSSPSSSISCALQCPHFESCSGCTHEYDLHYPEVVDKAAGFFKNVGVSDFTFDSCKMYGWRCRAKLAVRGTSMDPLIGLYEEGTHNVVDIPQCKAHHPNINSAIELLRRGITELNIEPYDEDSGEGELRYVQMAVTTHNSSLPVYERYKNGKVQVTLVWNSRSDTSTSFGKLNALTNFLWSNGGPRRNFHLIHSVWANFQTLTNNVIFGDKWRHLIGEIDFWEQVGGIDVYMTPSSFGQANTRAFDSLLRKLHKYVPFGSSVIDFYGGAGVIGLSLAATRKCRSIKCIEINKESKQSFEKTVSRLPLSIDSNMSWHLSDAAVEPLSWLVGADVVVVDPPRKGLDEPLLFALQSIPSAERKAGLSASGPPKSKDEKRPWILRAKESSVSVQSKTSWSESHAFPETLVYISCGWDSFKKDCKLLLSSKAWHLDKAHGFNFFPGTQSIEVLAIFKRVRGASIKKKSKKKTSKKKKSS